MAKIAYEINFNQTEKLLTELPEKPRTKFTAAEIVVKLQLKIKSALDKNYTFDDIANIVFKANGTAITGAILKKEYLLLEATQPKPKKKYNLKNPKLAKIINNDDSGE